MSTPLPLATFPSEEDDINWDSPISSPSSSPRSSSPCSSSPLRRKLQGLTLSSTQSARSRSTTTSSSGRWDGDAEDEGDDYCEEDVQEEEREGGEGRGQQASKSAPVSPRVGRKVLRKEEAGEEGPRTRVGEGRKRSVTELPPYRGAGRVNLGEGKNEQERDELALELSTWINASPSPFETDPTPRHSPLSRSFPLFPTFHPKTSSSSHESANSAPSNLPHSFTKGLDARGLPLVVDYDGEARDSKASGAGKKSSYGFIPGIGVGVGGETMASGGAEDDYDQERSQLA